HISTRADYSDDYRLLRLPNRRRRTQRNLAQNGSFGIVIEYDAEIRLLQISRNQLVRAIRFSDRKAMRSQALHVDPPVAYQLEKALDVSVLGPTHVWKRIVLPSFFVVRIVPARSIRHGNDQFELATEKRCSWNIHAGHADHDHASFQTRDTRSQLDRLIGISGRGDQHSISAVSTRPRVDLFGGFVG